MSKDRSSRKFSLDSSAGYPRQSAPLIRRLSCLGEVGQQDCTFHDDVTSLVPELGC